MQINRYTCMFPEYDEINMRRAQHRHLFLVIKIYPDTNNTTRYVTIHLLKKIYVIAIFVFVQLDRRQHGGMAYMSTSSETTIIYLQNDV
jgi:hypothetical protein